MRKLHMCSARCCYEPTLLWMLMLRQESLCAALKMPSITVCVVCTGCNQPQLYWTFTNQPERTTRGTCCLIFMIYGIFVYLRDIPGSINFGKLVINIPGAPVPTITDDMCVCSLIQSSSLPKPELHAKCYTQHYMMTPLQALTMQLLAF